MRTTLDGLRAFTVPRVKQNPQWKRRVSCVIKTAMRAVEQSNEMRSFTNYANVFCFVCVIGIAHALLSSGGLRYYIGTFEG